MFSPGLHATIDATVHPSSAVRRIGGLPGERLTSRRRHSHWVAPRAHLLDMSNHTIAPAITTWAELRTTDREVLNRAEVARLLAIDPRTVDHGIDDGTTGAARDEAAST